MLAKYFELIREDGLYLVAKGYQWTFPIPNKFRDSGTNSYLKLCFLIFRY
jgi:hypothetical protein